MSTLESHLSRGARRRTLVALAASLAVVATFASSCADEKTPEKAPAPAKHRAPGVRLLTFHYAASNGRLRAAYLLLPAWYGPSDNPPLPLVISPHGRGATGLSNIEFFGDLPGVGGFAVVSPDGMGRRLGRFSYGYAGQIDDLASMPRAAVRALPWLRIDRSRIFALGSSMGGQETALLVARHPRLLAGAAAMDSVTNLARRYRQMADLPCGKVCRARHSVPPGLQLQSLVRREVGFTPEQAPRAYAARSALSQARAIARSGVPFQIWWSADDRIVTDQAHQSGALFRAIRRIDECAPVAAFAGHWRHSTEMRASALLPIALAGFGLLRTEKKLPPSVRYEAPLCRQEPERVLLSASR